MPRSLSWKQQPLRNLMRVTAKPDFRWRSRTPEVTAGPVPAIHGFLLHRRRKTWMPATSAGMTPRGWSDPVEVRSKCNV